LKTYEAMFLLDNREVKKGWDPLKESLDGLLTRNGAELVVAKRWDERKLAYDVAKQRRATYYLTYFKSAPEKITEIRRDLELSGPVLRYLILNCEEIPAEAYEPEREFHLVDEPEAAEAPEPAQEEDEGESKDEANDQSKDQSKDEAKDEGAAKASAEGGDDAASEGGESGDTEEKE